MGRSSRHLCGGFTDNDFFCISQGRDAGKPFGTAWALRVGDWCGLRVVNRGRVHVCI